MPNEKDVIGSRYEIIHRAGNYAEVVTYLARDIESGENVLIKEFFSESIMERNENGEISIKPGQEVLYKSLLSDYEELCRYVMELPESSPAARPISVFFDRSTAYAVYSDTNVQTLEDYLARRGKINWLTVKKMIGPIVSLVSRMHADGIYHRGISPETLYVKCDGELLLGGLSIPAARTAQSEIASTLYFGYSAPEQYSSSSWQGSWTDVYSLAAVCYRMVTGTTPVEWRQRAPERPLTAPSDVTLGIPKYASDAIMKGLSIELSARYHTPDEFWCDVLAPSDGGTIRYAVPEIPKRSDTVAEERKIPVKTIALWVAVGILSASAVIFGAMAISSHIAQTYINPGFESSVPPPSQTEEPSSQEEISKPKPVSIPDLTGHDVEAVLLNDEYRDMFSFDIVRVFSEIERPGIIVEQIPPSSAVYKEGMVLTLSVSKGTERAFMPEVVGTTLHKAKALLEQEEIPYTVTYTLEGGHLEGRVLSASVETGGVVYRTTDLVELVVYGRPTENQ
ncbi:MAG: PASTA domain-containing protein [Oscillospiraceae bacterium]|nr:PASTA domain-containing protein [Oscillospiraceae bacterium]